MARFDPHMAYRLCALAEQSYWYDTFEPWALANGYKAARGFHEDSIQAKVLCDGASILIVFTATDLVVLKEWVKYDFDLRHSAMLGGWVHKGFRRALHAGGALPLTLAGALDSGPENANRPLGIYLQIVTYLAFNLFGQYGDLPVYVGGHSLGAAMAKMFLAELAEQQRLGRTPLIRPDQITACYTTGEPRIGNAKVAAAIEKIYGGRMFRGIFCRDWVPGVPFAWMGYRHSGQPHFINKAGVLAFGSESPYLLRLSGTDHLPQRYARSYANLFRPDRGEPRLPVIGGFRQFWQDFKEVVLHPGRGRAS